MSAHRVKSASVQMRDDVLFHDDFAAGMRFTEAGPGWRVRPVGPLPAGDGVLTSTPDGVDVVPAGTDPATGEPAFTDLDVRQDLRWAAFSMPVEAGPGPWPAAYDLATGALTAQADLSAQATGSHCGHEDRVTAAGLVMADFATGLVLDLLLTPFEVIALYERLPLAGSSHAAFSYRVPVARRAPDDLHRCAIRLDPRAGQAQWFLDGAQVLEVARLGRRALEAAHLVRNDPGPDEKVVPARVSVGLGLFTESAIGQGIRLGVHRLQVSRSEPPAPQPLEEGLPG